MMKRRKMLCLCMAVLLVFGLAGCGTEERDNKGRDNMISEPEDRADSQIDHADPGTGKTASDSEEEVVSWAESLGLHAAESVPESDGDTVAGAEADPVNQQILYLWEEGNMPAVTQYTENNGNYADNPDFRPYMVTFPVPKDTEVKGAVLINAGGAFQFRSDQTDGRNAGGAGT